MCSALHKSALVVGRVIGVCIPNTLCLTVNRPAANFLKVPATPIEGGDDRGRHPVRGPTMDRNSQGRTPTVFVDLGA